MRVAAAVYKFRERCASAFRPPEDLFSGENMEQTIQLLILTEKDLQFDDDHLMAFSIMKTFSGHPRLNDLVLKYFAAYVLPEFSFSDDPLPRAYQVCFAWKFMLVPQSFGFIVDMVPRLTDHFYDDLDPEDICFVAQSMGFYEAVTWPGKLRPALVIVPLDAKYTRSILQCSMVQPCAPTRSLFADRMQACGVWPAIDIKESERVLYDLLWHRIAVICVGLQSLRLPVLVLCEIVDRSWRRLGLLLPMHYKWKLVRLIKDKHTAISGSHY